MVHHSRGSPASVSTLAVGPTPAAASDWGLLERVPSNGGNSSTAAATATAEKVRRSKSRSKSRSVGEDDEWSSMGAGKATPGGGRGGAPRASLDSPSNSKRGKGLAGGASASTPRGSPGVMIPLHNGVELVMFFEPQQRHPLGHAQAADVASPGHPGTPALPWGSQDCPISTVGPQQCNRGPPALPDRPTSARGDGGPPPRVSYHARAHLAPWSSGEVPGSLLMSPGSLGLAEREVPLAYGGGPSAFAESALMSPMSTSTVEEGSPYDFVMKEFGGPKGPQSMSSEEGPSSVVPTYTKAPYSPWPGSEVQIAREEWAVRGSRGSPVLLSRNCQEPRQAHVKPPADDGRCNRNQLQNQLCEDKGEGSSDQSCAVSSRRAGSGSRHQADEVSVTTVFTVPSPRSSQRGPGGERRGRTASVGAANSSRERRAEGNQAPTSKAKRAEFDEAPTSGNPKVSLQARKPAPSEGVRVPSYALSTPTLYPDEQYVPVNSVWGTAHTVASDTVLEGQHADTEAGGGGAGGSGTPKESARVRKGPATESESGDAMQPSSRGGSVFLSNFLTESSEDKEDASGPGTELCSTLTPLATNGRRSGKEAAAKEARKKGGKSMAGGAKPKCVSLKDLRGNCCPARLAPLSPVHHSGAPVSPLPHAASKGSYVAIVPQVGPVFSPGQVCPLGTPAGTGGGTSTGTQQAALTLEEGEVSPLDSPPTLVLGPRPNPFGFDKRSVVSPVGRGRCSSPLGPRSPARGSPLGRTGAPALPSPLSRGGTSSAAQALPSPSGGPVLELRNAARSRPRSQSFDWQESAAASIKKGSRRRHSGLGPSPGGALQGRAGGHPIGPCSSSSSDVSTTMAATADVGASRQQSRGSSLIAAIEVASGEPSSPSSPLRSCLRKCGSPMGSPSPRHVHFNPKVGVRRISSFGK